MEPDTYQPKPLNPAPSFSGSRSEHSNRRSNHIVRHRPDIGPIIPKPTRVARPVTVTTTPEQAQRAAMIASTAFRPVMAPPVLLSNTPAVLNEDSTNQQLADEPKSSSTVKTIIIVLSILVVLLALAAGAGFYLALHKS